MPQSDKKWSFVHHHDDIIPELTGKIYQQKNRETILSYLKNNNCKFRNCCDIGAHIGIWSNDFVKNFEWVYAFEPIQELRECYKKNVEKQNYTLFPFGLGNLNGIINFKYDPKHSKNTQANQSGNYSAEIRKLDDLNLYNIDYIKMDAESYEFEILKGAIELLQKQSPFVHIEMKLEGLKKINLNKQDIRNWLLKLNYKQILKISNEFVFKKDD